MAGIVRMGVGSGDGRDESNRWEWSGVSNGVGLVGGSPDYKIRETNK